MLLEIVNENQKSTLSYENLDMKEKYHPHISEDMISWGLSWSEYCCAADTTDIYMATTFKKHLQGLKELYDNYIVVDYIFEGIDWYDADIDRHTTYEIGEYSNLYGCPFSEFVECFNALDITERTVVDKVNIVLMPKA